MKYLTSLIILFSFISNVVLADNCDWTQIKKLPDGGYEYNPTLNLCVGNLVQDNKTKDAQIADLNKAIDLKNLAISYSDSRVALWQKSANDELAITNKIESEQRHNDFIYFGLGILATIGTGLMAARLIGH